MNIPTPHCTDAIYRVAILNRVAILFRAASLALTLLAISTLTAQVPGVVTADWNAQYSQI
ncbi:MAG: hypothetical protein GY869_18955, partial [Planctomycetes bacterium]|nr:hypothetical protein [Planctomycetota bacterium]